MNTNSCPKNPDQPRSLPYTVASELWGQVGVHCTPKFRTCTPCAPQVIDATYVKILTKPTLTQDCIRFVQICTPPLTKTFRRAWPYRQTNEPRASAHRGKWGRLTPWKNGRKLKSENMQKRAVFWIFWEQSGRAGAENGAMLTIYLFRYTSERTIS